MKSRIIVAGAILLALGSVAQAREVGDQASVVPRAALSSGKVGERAVENGTVFWNEGTGAASALDNAGVLTGTSRDVGAPSGSLQSNAYFNAFFRADQGGTASIECSNDNATWYVCATAAIVANTSLTLSIRVMTEFHRAKVVNGATPNTFLYVNTSYTAS